MTTSRRLSIAALALAIAAVACSGGSDPAADTPGTAPQGTPAPTRSFDLFDGTSTTLAAFEGQPVVLNFWASWCPSCVAEMSAAFRPVEQRLGDEVTFIGMNIQDVRELADSLLLETGVDWTNAVDPDGDLYVDLGGLGMPFTVFIDERGQILDEHNGPLTESQLADQISELFGVEA